MYKIYSTTKGTRVCIYDGFVSDPKVKLIDPELELSANSPGSLTFSIPPCHVAYNDYRFVELDILRPGSENAMDMNGVQCVFRGYVESEDALYGLGTTPIIGDIYPDSVFGYIRMPSTSVLRKDDNGKWYFPGIDMRNPDAVSSAWENAREKNVILELTANGWAIAEGPFNPSAVYRVYLERPGLHIGDVYGVLSVPPSDEMTIVNGKWSLTGVDMTDASAVSTRWNALYSNYFTQSSGGWVGATRTFNPDNAYRRWYNDDDNYMVFGTGEFDAVSSALPPVDWDYTYDAKYYYFDESRDIYVNPPSDLGAPDYEQNEYYIRLWDHVYTGTNIYKEKETTLNLVERMISKITVTRLETNNAGTRFEKEIWEGRVMSEEVDWDGKRKIYAEGIFGYLNDTLQPQKVYSSSTTLYKFLHDVITYHNSKVADDHKFELYNIPGKTGAADNSIVIGTVKTDYGSTMEVLSNFVETYGGYFDVLPPANNKPWHRLTYIEKRSGDYTAEEREELIANNRVIRLGKNLLDFTKKWDLSELVTSIIPAGGTKNEVQPTAGDEIVGSETAKKVLASKDAYTYTLQSTQPANWSTTYYEYYTKSNTTANGYKKVSKSRNGSVPDFATTGPYYSRSATTGPTVQICGASSSYKISRRVVWAGGGAYSRKYFYLTTVIDKGHYAYCWYYVNQNDQEILLDVNSGRSTTTKTYTEQKLQSPDTTLIPANAKKVGIIICCYGDSAMAFKRQDDDKNEEFDKRYRITDYPNDGEWHKQGSEYISNPALVDKYGYIERQVTFDGITKASTEESDADVVSRLYAEAKKYLTSTQFDKMAIEVEAMDLRVMGVKYDAINIYDLLLVISPPHGLDKIFEVTSITIPIAHPEEQRITLGYETDSTISGVTVSTASGLRAEVASIPSTNTTLKQAKERAKELIFGDSQRGVVRFEEGNGTSTTRIDTEGTIRAIEIVSTNQASAQNIGKWRWSYGGLGFATSTNGGTTWSDPLVAITNDGAIVADLITTGNLNAARINGGVLTLGGENASAGRLESQMEIRDASDNLIATADEDGYRSYGAWNQNKSQFTKIDDGYLTAGEATRNSSTGAISETQYGKIYPNYTYIEAGTVTEPHAIAIAASYGGSTQGEANNGALIIAAKKIGLTKNTLEGGGIAWGATTNGSMSVMASISPGSAKGQINIHTYSLTVRNGVIIGITDDGTHSITINTD